VTHVRDILSRITKWWEAGETFGLATVVGTYRSAPRDPGAALAVSSTTVSSTADNEVVGSVSGGCVEGAVYELSLEVCRTGNPVLQTYGVSDDDAFAVGLTCGGIIDIFVEPVAKTRFPELGEIADAVERGEPVAVATVIAGPGQIGARRVIWAGDARTESAADEGGRPEAASDSWHVGASGTLGSGPRLDAAVDDDARGMLAQGLTGIRRYGAQGERRGDELSVFVNSFAPAPRMLVFGAIDFAAAVARVGKFLGYQVTVCDARKVFATASRFPDADEVVVDWPHRFLASTDVDARTVICVLTHDPKFDVPLLEVALRTPAGYIGAMGSRRTHDDRLARLREVGLTEEELTRLRSPIGLDLGARTPEETAVSVAAELIQLRWGGTGQPLTATAGRIHHQFVGLPWLFRLRVCGPRRRAWSAIGRWGWSRTRAAIRLSS
jgi:xanthine dehydrogenase accessory factor